MSVNREALKEKYGDEEVLVVPLSELQLWGLNGEGLLNKEMQLDTLDLILKHSYFIPRYLSDFNPHEVEIIPYLTLRHGQEHILTYKRIKNGDVRGNGAYSVGIGGHVNREDLKWESMNQVDIRKACYRELCEEIGGQFREELFGRNMWDGYYAHIPEYGMEFKGYIRCLGSDYDRDHLGLSFEMQLGNRVDEVAEKHGMLLLGMITKTALETEFYDKLENWSKMLIKSYK